MNNKGDKMDVSGQGEPQPETRINVGQEAGQPRRPSLEDQERYKKQELKQYRMRFVGPIIQGILSNHHYMQNNCKDERTQAFTADALVIHAVKLTDALIKELEK